MARRRGNDEIGLREGVAGLAAVFDQEPPFEHDVFADREHALLEHRPHLLREPVIEFGAAAGIGDALDAEADFGKAHRADIEKAGRNYTDEQRNWLMAIRDHPRVNIEIRPEDLMDAPEFSGRGGVVRARALFGPRLPGLLDELTDTLVA
jgi:hypothetical protein